MLSFISNLLKKVPFDFWELFGGSIVFLLIILGLILLYMTLFDANVASAMLGNRNRRARICFFVLILFTLILNSIFNNNLKLQLNLTLIFDISILILLSIFITFFLIELYKTNPGLARKIYDIILSVLVILSLLSPFVGSKTIDDKQASFLATALLLAIILMTPKFKIISNLNRIKNFIVNKICSE